MKVKHGIECRVDCEVDSKGDVFCGLCCFETEMPLTDEDVKRLEEVGYRKEDFSIVINGIRRLRNVEGRCFFLSSDNRCKVYNYRPEGCRLYPAILNSETMEVEVDKVCPKASRVKVGEEVKQALIVLVKKIYGQKS